MKVLGGSQFSKILRRVKRYEMAYWNVVGQQIEKCKSIADAFPPFLLGPEHSIVIVARDGVVVAQMPSGAYRFEGHRSDPPMSEVVAQLSGGFFCLEYPPGDRVEHEIVVKEGVISDSLFDRINRADSPINLLVGAKKFIEGWLSWRVSSMGLLRIGKGEGSQVIQLFGRGVRLKGKDKSLKRSHPSGGAPEWLESLETLYVVGWNADYLQTFREMLAREDLGKELPPLRVAQKDVPTWALVPQAPAGFDPSAETWVLNNEGPRVVVDLLPQVVSLAPEDTEMCSCRAKRCALS